MKRLAIISAGFIPLPAVVGGAGSVLVTEIINENEEERDFFIDIYTIESPKLQNIQYKNSEIIQIHIKKRTRFLCKMRNLFLKIIKRKYRYIPYNRELLKKFRDNYDVILVENNMQVYEDIYKHITNGKKNMVFHMHNDINNTTKPEYLCKMIIETARVILPVSMYIKNRLNSVLPNNKMEILYNCVDTELFSPMDVAESRRKREKYNLDSNDFVFLYAGSLYAEKGVLELVKAFRKVQQVKKNAKLLIVGSVWYDLIEKDEYFNKLVAESEKCGESIVFTGYIYPKEMPEVYAIADAMVVPTLCEEAFGVVALEGMAMKLPIIATNSGGLVEVLDKENAIIVDKQQEVIKQLEMAMMELMNDEEIRLKMIESAGKKFIQHSEFDKRNYYRNFLEIINSYF